MIKKENRNLLTKQNYNFILKRVEWLRQTAKEMQSHYKKTKDKLIQELYLEIQCYTNQIEDELKVIKRGGLKDKGD
jgi:hypothetical protein